MTFTSLLRGFRVPVAVLDAFLEANGMDETNGYPPFGDQDPVISSLLCSKMGTNLDSARIFIPDRRSFNTSSIAYVAYKWVKVYAQREIDLDEDLPSQVPVAFIGLKDEIMGFAKEEHFVGTDKGKFGKVGLFMVFNQSVSWLPAALEARSQIPISCGLCHQSFESFDERQLHRNHTHGVPEGTNPLPDA